MRVRTNLAIDALALAVYLVATNPVTTGTAAHEWLGLGIAFVGFVHLLLHWDWVGAMTRRFATRVSPVARADFLIDAALLVTVTAVALSGLLVSQTALSWLGRRVAEDSVWHAVHARTTTVLLALVGLHLGTHFAWLRAAGMRVLRAPRRRQAPRPAGAGMLAVRRTVSAAAVVAIVAAVVYVAAPAANGGPAWLQLPGGTSAALASGRTRDAEASGQEAVRVGRKALGLSADEQQRIAIRTGHSLAVVAVAFALGVAARELLRPTG